MSQVITDKIYHFVISILFVGQDNLNEDRQWAMVQRKKNTGKLSGDVEQSRCSRQNYIQYCIYHRYLVSNIKLPNRDCSSLVLS